MTNLTTKEKDLKYIMHTYGRYDVALKSAKGVTAYDENGKKYIDVSSGIGVNSLGYCNDGWVEAVSKQAVEVVIHKNQRTEQRGRYQSGALTFQVAGGPLTVSAGAAGFLHEHNDHAQKDHEHQNGKIHTIDHCVKQRIKRNPRVEFCRQQCAKGTPRKQ